jgi:hypothetical protein
MRCGCCCDRVIDGCWLRRKLRAHPHQRNLPHNPSELHSSSRQRLRESFSCDGFIREVGDNRFAAPSSGDDAHPTVGPIGMLGIPEETAQLVASLKDPEERTSGGIRVILGKLANQSVLLCQVGFGKVNAGIGRVVQMAPTILTTWFGLDSKRWPKIFQGTKERSNRLFATQLPSLLH